MDTRVAQLLAQLQKRCIQRWRALQSLFPLAPLFMLAGFYVGNGFATSVKYIRWVSWWEGMTIFLLVFLLESIQKLLARPRTRILWMIHYAKFGFLWGLFVDAFKVGS